VNIGERRPLLEKMSRLKHIEAENINAASTFLPLPTHRLALRSEIVVVRGGRGAGKSALFRLLKTEGDELREFFEDQSLPDARFVDVFSDDSKVHPWPSVLDSLASQVSDAALRAFWMVHLLIRLTREMDKAPALPIGLVQAINGHELEPVYWVSWAEKNLGQVATGLDVIDTYLGAQKLTSFATYDHLDRLGGFDRSTRGRLSSTLLALWLSLSNRFRNLRAKIFLRDDLFEDAERSFPDASKLRPRSVSLDWDVESLYRVVFRHLAAKSDEHPSRQGEMLAWLDSIPALTFKQNGKFGLIPGEAPERVQRAFAKKLAGEVMGRGVKKGYTHRWIPNRLQDARVRIVPRSILTLLGNAAEHASQKPLGSNEARLLRPQSLAAALRQTSLARVTEVAEEYPIVKRLENLRGMIVLLKREDAVAKLGKPVRGEPQGLQVDGNLVLDELVRLGVLKIRDDGRIDVPDIYRYGYGILRKGGVAQPD